MNPLPGGLIADFRPDGANAFARKATAPQGRPVAAVTVGCRIIDKAGTQRVQVDIGGAST